MIMINTDATAKFFNIQSTHSIFPGVLPGHEIYKDKLGEH